MAELDNLLGSRISLITQQDIRYEGVLFSINQNESSIVLRDVKYFGTEDRPVEKKIAGNDAVLAFVSFPGNEIKDLYVHEGDEAAPNEDKVEETASTMPPPPPVQSTSGPPAVPQTNKTKGAPKQQQQQPRQQQQQSRQQQQQSRQQQQPRQQQQKSNNNNNRAKKEAAAGAVGTGAHLLNLRERTTTTAGDSAPIEKLDSAFDFEGGLTSFKKDEVLAEVASEQSGEVKVDTCYKKDNFFDMLSSSSMDEQSGGRRERMSAGEERVLNQDTFGAIALQQTNRHRYGGRGRGRGGGGKGHGGRGGGRGGYHKNNNRNYNNNHNNNNRQGQGQGQRANPVAAK